MTRQRGEMNDELFHKIIKESKEFCNPQIVPFLNGEPFVFSRIWKWLDYMKEQNCRVYLYSNAEFIDIDRIIKYPNIRYICCSINAATKRTYDKIMRGPDYNKVKHNVEELIKKAPFKVYSSMVITSDNQSEVEEFKKQWGRHTIFGEFKNWGGARHDEIEKKGIRVPCQSLMRAITILWDGRVAACCMDYNGQLILGDANKKTLSEIWTESKWLRDKHSKLDFSMIPCKDCNQNI
jgi:radical SAM protein with 4Fe4S-binding SPASM domain